MLVGVRRLAQWPSATSLGLYFWPKMLPDGNIFGSAKNMRFVIVRRLTRWPTDWPKGQSAGSATLFGLLFWPTIWLRQIVGSAKINPRLRLMRWPDDSPSENHLARPPHESRPPHLFGLQIGLSANLLARPNRFGDLGPMA